MWAEPKYEYENWFMVARNVRQAKRTNRFLSLYLNSLSFVEIFEIYCRDPSCSPICDSAFCSVCSPQAPRFLFAFVAWGKPFHFNSMVLKCYPMQRWALPLSSLSPYLTKGIYKTMLSAYINVVSVWTVFRYCCTVPYFGPEYKLWLFPIEHFSFT